MMKRLISLCLLALLALAPLSSLAQTPPAFTDGYATIGELREQTPDRWVQTYETKWRDVEIDAPIIQPDTEAVPIVKVKHGVPESAITPEESGWTEIERRFDSLLLYNGWKHAPKSVGGKRVNSNVEAHETWRSGFAPEARYVPMSDISYGEICDMIRAELTRFGYDAEGFELDTPTEMWAQHWFYYGYKKDAVPGQLFLTARQRLNGLPILEHIFRFVHDNDLYGILMDGGGANFGLDGGYDAYGGKVSHLYVTAAIPVEYVARDIPLCSVDKVLAAIEPEIEAGHIRKVYEVELGYVPYNEPGAFRKTREPMVEGRNTREEMDAERMAEIEAASYYLRPMWQVNCLWVSSPRGKLRETASYTTDERNTLDYRQFLVDAQTGELVEQSGAEDRCDFKGFISWEDVKEQ